MMLRYVVMFQTLEPRSRPAQVWRCCNGLTQLQIEPSVADETGG